MLIKLLIGAVIALALYAAYQLWKSKKAVTGANVIAQATTDVKTEKSKL
jgi:hypothetical protein